MRSCLILAAALGLAAPSQALSIKPKAFPNQGIFGIECAGSDVGFYARADQILSVSFQEYAAGSFLVAEVVVDIANSNQQLRIYSVRPAGSADVADRANRGLKANAQNRGLEADQATQVPLPGPLANLEQKVNNVTSSTTAGLVVKSYPATTHAKTVEMSIPSRTEVLAFYKAFRDLMVAREVTISQGSTVAGGTGVSSAATNVFGSKSNTGTPAATTTGEAITINRIGGALFTLE